MTSHPLLKNFSKEAIISLEEIVDKQIKNFSEYSVALNFHLLKLYQFHSKELKLEYVANILALALCRLPQNDFQMALCLIPETIQKEAQVSSLVSMGRLLEATKFCEFWKSQTPVNIPFFNTEIRRYISEVLTMTFRSLEKKEVQEYLNFKPEELSQFLKDQKNEKWETQEDRINLWRQPSAAVPIKAHPSSDFTKILSVTRSH